MTDTCCFCGAPATSDEHVPPKGIFPQLKDSPDGRDYRVNLITVRACDLHNRGKSSDDEYLLYVLAMSLPSNEIAKSQFLTKIRRAVHRTPKLLDALLLRQQPVRVHDRAKDEWHDTIAIQPDEARLAGIFAHIAKGVYFHETQHVWGGDTTVLIEFMLSLTDVKWNQGQTALEARLNVTFANVPHQGQNPDVFSYQLLEENGQPLVRLHFYGNARVTVGPSLQDGGEGTSGAGQVELL